MDVVCLACRPEELHRLSHGWQCHVDRGHVVQIQPQENVSTQDTGMALLMYLLRQLALFSSQLTYQLELF